MHGNSSNQRLLEGEALPINHPALELAAHDAEKFCCQHIEDIYGFWVALLRSRGSITGGQPEWQSNAINIFRQIDRFMNENQDNHRLRRMAFIGLAILIEDTKKAIAVNRRSGGIESRPGQRNASLAVDLYLAAQEPIVNRKRAKSQLNRMLGTSRRWLALSKGCPLLSVAFSANAEKIIANPRFAIPRLRQIGLLASSSYTRLVAALGRLISIAELSANGFDQDVKVEIQRVRESIERQ